MMRQRIRTSRQASATTGRKAGVASPFMPRYKPWEKPQPPSPQALTEELAPLPKKKVISPGTAADMGPDTGPHGGGRGLGLAHGVSDIAVGGFLSKLGLAALGPWGAAAGAVALPVARGLAFGDPLGDDIDKPSADALGWAEATQADLEMRGLGVNTYAGEVGGGYGGVGGRGDVEGPTGGYGFGTEFGSETEGFGMI